MVLSALGCIHETYALGTQPNYVRCNVGGVGYSRAASGQSVYTDFIKPLEVGTSVGPGGDKNVVGTFSPSLRLVFFRNYLDPQIVGEGRLYLWRVLGSDAEPVWGEAPRAWWSRAGDPWSVLYPGFDFAAQDNAICGHRPCKYLGRNRHQWASAGILTEGGWQFGHPGPDVALGVFALLELAGTHQLGVEAGWQRVPEGQGAFLRLFVDFGWTVSVRSHVHTSAHKQCSPDTPENCPEK